MVNFDFAAKRKNVKYILLRLLLGKLEKERKYVALFNVEKELFSFYCSCKK